MVDKTFTVQQIREKFYQFLGDSLMLGKFRIYGDGHIDQIEQFIDYLESANK